MGQQGLQPWARPAAAPASPVALPVPARLHLLPTPELPSAGRLFSILSLFKLSPLGSAVHGDFL